MGLLVTTGKLKVELTRCLGVEQLGTSTEIKVIMMKILIRKFSCYLAMSNLESSLDSLDSLQSPNRNQLVWRFEMNVWTERQLFQISDSHFNTGVADVVKMTQVATTPLGRIGFAIARRLAQEGAHVVISSRKQQNVDQAVAMLKEEGLSVTGTVCHVGKAKDREHLVATALEHSGGVDFLVCVAGVNPLVGSTLGSSEQIWDKILDVNVKAPAMLLSQLLPHMENRRGSSVVLVSSMVAYLPIPALGVYNTSKTALLGLCKSLAVELAPKGIRVNCIVPGIINTDFSQVWGHPPAKTSVNPPPNIDTKIFQRKSLTHIQPAIKDIYGLLRIGEPEECAGIVSFLCSSDASFITGENIAVAGFSPKL
ncbi:PREDICTED: dehydrogenase/reductase SDR family member 2, mitochondrial-like [Dipodomys ordii]|uniref:Dehydrogenase/reductase SDR family member 4 n=1 Tax=Dipodomys ordii TaxID=10020 RepID=A0A1S3FXL4_DIPOR|nr:PREDICTED: dehydrogenase/reductase SDR family member 2, mitochondrial-like [Dipodomys ordii]